MLGVAAFDLLLGTAGLHVPRYASACFPAAMLLLGYLFSRMRTLPGWVAAGILIATWIPINREVFFGPSRPMNNMPLIAQEIERELGPGDLVVVHSIPSGVPGLARYLEPDVEILSWIPRLKEPSFDDIETILAGRCRVALVSANTQEPSSRMDVWLAEHATLEEERNLGWLTGMRIYELNQARPASSPPCRAAEPARG